MARVQVRGFTPVDLSVSWGAGRNRGLATEALRIAGAGALPDRQRLRRADRRKKPVISRMAGGSAAISSPPEPARDHFLDCTALRNRPVYETMVRMRKRSEVRITPKPSFRYLSWLRLPLAIRAPAIIIVPSVAVSLKPKGSRQSRRSLECQKEKNHGSNYCNSHNGNRHTNPHSDHIKGTSFAGIRLHHA